MRCWPSTVSTRPCAPVVEARSGCRKRSGSASVFRARACHLLRSPEEIAKPSRIRFWTACSRVRSATRRRRRGSSAAAPKPCLTSCWWSRPTTRRIRRPRSSGSEPPSPRRRRDGSARWQLWGAANRRDVTGRPQRTRTFRFQGRDLAARDPGLASADPQDFIDERRLAPHRSQFRRVRAPGRVLVWPGQFVIGYRRQDGLELTKPRNPSGAEGALATQRLLSGVSASGSRRCIVLAILHRASESPEREDRRTGSARKVRSVPRRPLALRRTAPSHPSSRIVPISPADDNANNDFFFSEQTPAVTLADGTTAGAAFPPVERDPRGSTCPFPAHIRKVNPRDDPSDTSGPRKTRTRLMLRRGIPYGPAPASDSRSKTMARIAAFSSCLTRRRSSNSSNS